MNHKGIISAAEREFFQVNGYLIKENFISPSQCDELIKQADKLLDSFDIHQHKVRFSTLNHQHASHRYFLDSADKIHCFFEDKAWDENEELCVDKKHSINKIGHSLHNLDPVFHRFSKQDAIRLILNEMGIPSPRVLQSMYIFKQPGIGGEVACHQDSSFLYTENEPVTGLWFALEDATQENGCLWAIPGEHRFSLRSRMVRDDSDDIRMEVFDDSPWPEDGLIPLEVSKGSLIILHGLLPHMSKENNSPLSRQAYTMHFMDRSNRFAKDNWMKIS